MVADWGCRWKRVNGDDPASGRHAVNERMGQYELLARRQFDLAGEFQRLGVHGVSVPRPAIRFASHATAAKSAGNSREWLLVLLAAAFALGLSAAPGFL